MRTARQLSVLCVTLALIGCEGGIADERLRVLVTNDDGISAPGIAALVDELARNPALDLVVIAPDGNRSGSGDQYSSTPIDVRVTTTASGFAAKSVSGFPADGPLFAILHDLPTPPELVVSGINLGQNIGEFSNISGTVGAALWSARLGVPALAFSQGIPASDYSAAATYAGEVVERFRTDEDFRELMRANRLGRARVINVNFPECTAAAPRGVRVVPLGRVNQPAGFELTSTNGDVSTFTPIIESANAFSSDCTSTSADPETDVDALINGFASVTPLNTDLTSADVSAFAFLER
jgi:5'-nucleotidase